MCGPYPRRLAPEGEEDGSYLVLGAVLLTALFLAAGVGVDLSRKFRLEQMTQDIADAAAVAAARALPDSVAARQVAIEYIRQHVGGPTIDTAAFYTPADSDIAVFVHPLTLTSGTVGVVVRANWDPIFIPSFLEGSQLMAIERYAIAVMTRGVTYDTIPGSIQNAPGGPYALFVGDSNPVLSSKMTGNNAQIIGSAHFNHCAEVSGNGSEILQGTFEATCLTGSISGTTDVPTAYVDPPRINASALVFDVLLDQTNSNQAAYYTSGATQTLVRPGADGLYGTGDDIPVYVSDSAGGASNGGVVTVKYLGGDRWEIYRPGNNDWVTGAGNTTDGGVGNGIDLKVKGDLSLGGTGSQFNWVGSFQVGGKVSLFYNNSEVRASLPSAAIAGLDNTSLAFYTGYELPAGQLAFETNGNAPTIYGVMYIDGTMQWSGNMSNPASSSPGTPGAYDGTGNGFVKGMIIADDFDPSGGGSGTLSGNNIKIWYDGTIAGGLPVLNAVTPPRLGSAVVALIE